MQDRYNDIPNHLKDYIVTQDYDEYTCIDHSCWNFIMKISKNFFKDHAHESYLLGLEKTGITIDSIPKISDMDNRLQEIGWRAAPVRGFLPPTIFMQFQAHGVLPIASDMRTVSHLTYTPAPDIVHEAAGHSPIIADSTYSQFLKEYGDAASKAIYSKDDYNIYLAIRHLSDIKENPRTTFDDIKNAEIALDTCISNTKSISEAAYLARLNWWTVEYGLVGSIDNPKIYGAGLLSSVSESYNAIFGDVKKIPLSLDCINYSYDITEQQPQLFIADDFEHLSKVLKDFTLNMAYNTGGIASVKKAIESESICTYKFDTGLQVSGIPVDFKGSNRIDFYKFSGPVQISYNNKQLKNHGGDYHSHGFSSPLCNDDIIEKLISSSIEEKLSLQFSNGITLSGVVKEKIYEGSILLLVSFDNCEIKLGDEILFSPNWGQFDLACGKSIISVHGGPADLKNYLKFINLEDPITSKPIYIKEPSKDKKNLNLLYERIDALSPKTQLEKPVIVSLIDELDEKYPDDWLSRFKIMEILFAKDNQLYDILRSQIDEISNHDSDLNESIRRAIKVLETISD